MMRLFLGVFPPVEVVARVADLCRELQRLPGMAPGRGGPRWVSTEKLHVTLAFLGQQDEALVSQLVEQLGPVLAGLPEFDARLEGLGGFPKPQRARVLWVGLDQGRSEFEHLAASVFEGLGQLGLTIEDGRFHPHLTLARAGNRPLRVPQVTVPDPLTFRVRELAIVESELTPQTSRYRVRATLSLRGR